MSSQGNAIVARMGVDLTGLKNDLKNAEKVAEASAYSISSKMTRAQQSGRNAGAHTGKGSSGHGGGASNARAVGDTLDAVTGTKGWVGKASMFEHSATLGGLAGGVMAIDKMSEALQQLAEANAAARKELSKPLAITVAQGPEAVKAAMESIEKVKEELTKGLTGSNGVAAALGSQILDPMLKLSNKMFGTRFEEDGLGKAVGNREALEQRRFELSAALADKVKEEAATRHELLSSDREELAIFEAQRETKEKIAKIKADTTVLPDARKALEKQAVVEGADKERDIGRGFAKGRVELDLEQKLTAIKHEGLDVALREAQARYEAAKQLGALESDRVARQKASANINALAEQVREVQIETEARKKQLEIAKAVADYQGDADNRHMIFLKLQSAELTRQLSDPKLNGDKRKEVEKSFSENQQQMRDAELAHLQKTHALANTLADAGQGRGEAEQLRVMQQKLAIAESYAAQIDKAKGATDNQKAEAANVVNQLRNQIAEQNEGREKGVRSAKEQNQALSEELAHRQTAAAILRIQADFEERIREAKKNQNAELATELARQRDLTIELQRQAKEQRLREQVQSSLQELASKGHGKTRSDARRALDYEKKAKDRAAHGDIKGAEALQDKANRIKDGLDSLQDSSKSPDRGDRGKKPSSPTVGELAVDPELSRRMKAAGDMLRPRTDRELRERVSGMQTTPAPDRPTGASQGDLQKALDSSAVLKSIEQKVGAPSVFVNVILPIAGFIFAGTSFFA